MKSEETAAGLQVSDQIEKGNNVLIEGIEDMEGDKEVYI
jgi:hypothetical protein